MSAHRVWFSDMPSPVGQLLMARTEAGLTHLHFQEGRDSLRPEPAWERSDARLAGVRDQLEEYFAGRRLGFELELAPEGTPFQLDVWRALCEIPYGETRSYGELARRVGRPGAARAVGAANGSNPIAIVIPCHRVIGKDGSLTGFGGGLCNKEILLDLEREHAEPRGQAALFGAEPGRRELTAASPARR